MLDLKSTLTAFIKYCRKRNATRLFPEDLTIPKGARPSGKTILQPNDLITLFTSDETTFRNHVIKDDLINAYRLQVITGLRPGDLIALEWRDVVNGKIYVRRAINKYGEITKGKNENAIRSFVIPAIAEQILADQRQFSPNGRIFPDLTQVKLYEHWKVYCKHNGIQPISPYELRHTFVSISDELPEGLIKPLVGHSKSMDTFGIYGHEVMGQQQAAAEKINGIFAELLQKRAEK